MSSFDYITGLVEEILKSNDIAEIFDVRFNDWQRRVFYGNNNGFTFAKNRGRLPFLTFELTNEDFIPEAAQGGTNSMFFTVTFHQGKLGKNRNQLKTDSSIRNAMTVLSRKLKAKFDTSSTVSPIRYGETEDLPWGWRKAAGFEVDLSYEQENYGEFNV